MKVTIKTENGQFTAQLALPRALVFSAVLAVGGFVTEAIRCETNIRQLKAQLAQCQKQPDPTPATIGAQ